MMLVAQRTIHFQSHLSPLRALLPPGRKLAQDPL
jgi:hypothetical protein